MDEQLKKLLLDAAQKGINGVEQTIDWVATQAPDLLEQLVMYNLIQSGIYLLICVIGIFVAYKMIVKSREKDPEWPEPIFMFVGMLVAIFSILAFICNISTFIKCLVAPKLFIFEYLSSLLN